MKHQFRRDWDIELLVAACLAATIGQAQTPMARTQFEVASIKPHPGIGNLVHIQPLPGGRLVNSLPWRDIWHRLLESRWHRYRDGQRRPLLEFVPMRRPAVIY